LTGGPVLYHAGRVCQKLLNQLAKTITGKSKESRIAEGEAILASIFSSELAIAA